METFSRKTEPVIQGVRKDYHEASHKTITLILEQAARSNVKLLDPAEVLCDSHRCKITQGNHFIYRDDDHLNPKGALLLTPLFKSLFIEE